MTTAMDRVFNTVELLEAILVNLDLKTVLMTQRVHRTWKCTIQSSPRLQEKLFLRPTSVNTSILLPVYPFQSGPKSSSRSFIMGSVIGNPPMQRNPFLHRSVIDQSDLPEGSTPGIVPSWRNMLISQPAPETMIFRVNEGSDHFETSVTNAGGVRLGQILDELRSPSREHKEA
ncbi:hypothetical protein CERZMDRAFT_85541 [Cercospora zeae-maydis SCOH1-5]|uniref:F-box domain-containing protein n=1 Tax=Cercospora zeae-maydis SCOH1-5 TaxID=717836 RepID=A0A6A6FDB2_9PEZI|nr:hypothetical protein CERZMDRAFT_85541 [Cercospora zeae-maydis SCOH1-5]